MFANPSEGEGITAPSRPATTTNVLDVVVARPTMIMDGVGAAGERPSQSAKTSRPARFPLPRGGSRPCRNYYEDNPEAAPKIFSVCFSDHHGTETRFTALPRTVSDVSSRDGDHQSRRDGRAKLLPPRPVAKARSGKKRLQSSAIETKQPLLSARAHVTSSSGDHGRDCHDIVPAIGTEQNNASPLVLSSDSLPAAWQPLASKNNATSTVVDGTHPPPPPPPPERFANLLDILPRFMVQKVSKEGETCWSCMNCKRKIVERQKNGRHNTTCLLGHLRTCWGDDFAGQYDSAAGGQAKTVTDAGNISSISNAKEAPSSAISEEIHSMVRCYMIAGTDDQGMVRWSCKSCRKTIPERQKNGRLNTTCLLAHLKWCRRDAFESQSGSAKRDEATPARDAGNSFHRAYAVDTEGLSPSPETSHLDSRYALIVDKFMKPVRGASGCWKCISCTTELKVGMKSQGGKLFTAGDYSNLVRHLKGCVGRDVIRRLESELSNSHEKPWEERPNPTITVEPAARVQERSDEALPPGPGKCVVPVTIVPDWSHDVVLNAGRSFSPQEYATLVNAITSAPVTRNDAHWEDRLYDHVVDIMSKTLRQDQPRFLLHRGYVILVHAVTSAPVNRDSAGWERALHDHAADIMNNFPGRYLMQEIDGSFRDAVVFDMPDVVQEILSQASVPPGAPALHATPRNAGSQEGAEGTKKRVAAEQQHHDAAPEHTLHRDKRPKAGELEAGRDLSSALHLRSPNRRADQPPAPLGAQPPGPKKDARMDGAEKMGAPRNGGSISSCHSDGVVL